MLTLLLLSSKTLPIWLETGGNFRTLEPQGKLTIHGTEYMTYNVLLSSPQEFGLHPEYLLKGPPTIFGFYFSTNPFLPSDLSFEVQR